MKEPIAKIGRAITAGFMLGFALVAIVAAEEFVDTDENELRHNPFLRPTILAAAAPVTARDQAGRWRPELRATLVSGAVPLVNVAGNLLALGEEFEGYRLIRVIEGEATFEKDGEQIMLLVNGSQGERDE